MYIDLIAFIVIILPIIIPSCIFRFQVQKDSSKMATKKMPNVVLKLLFMLCFDMISIGLIVPLITPFMRSLGATPSEIGMISSVYGLTQLISSPVLGRMSDRLSRRSIIILSLLGGAVGYGLLGMATNVKMVIASRVIVGIFRQTMTVTKAWVTDNDVELESKDEEKKSTGKYLSYFYATASFGFMIGPAIGGKLAKYNEEMGLRLPFLISTLLFVINAFGVITFLPPGKVKQDVVTIQTPKTLTKKTKSWWNSFAALRPEVRGLMIVRFFIGISIMMSRSGIFMLMEYKLEMDVVDKGYIMSLYAIGGLVTQLFIGKYSKRCRSNVAVIIVRVIGISLFLFYCLLSNHSFQTNPNRITNCFKLILSLLQFYNYICSCVAF